MNFFALHRNVRLRIGILFVQRLVDTMVATFIAIYLAERVGAGLTGLLILLLAVFAMAAMLLGGHLAENRGRRPVLIAGEAIACACFALMALAHYAHWGALAVFFSYAAVKFGTSLGMPANDSMIVDVTTSGTRTFVYTINYWAINLSLAGGAMLGGFLYGTHFGVLIVAAAAGMGGALLVTVLFVTETRPERAATAVASTRGPLGQMADGYRVVLVDRVFRRLLIAATLGMTLELQMNNYVGVRLATGMPEQELFPFGSIEGASMLGLLKAENTLLVVVLALLAPVVLRRMPMRARLYGGMTLFTAGFAVLAVSTTVWVLLLACLVLTIGEILHVPAKQTLLADLAPEEGRSRYMAAYNLNIRVAQSLAALFISLGAILSPWGISAVFVLMGLVALSQYRAILGHLAERGRSDVRTPTGAGAG